MSWQENWQAQMEGVEETENRVGKIAAATLLVLLAHERTLRRRVVAHALDVPVTPRGFFDGANRTALRRLRTRSQRDVLRFQNDVLGQLVGRVDPFNPVQDFGSPRRGPRGPVPQAIRGASHDFANSWRKARAIEQRDLSKIPSPPTSGRNGLQAIEPAPVRSLLSRIEPIEAMPDDQAGDEWEMTEDARINIVRNLSYGAQRLLEDIHRQANRFGSAKGIVALANGSDDSRETSKQNPGAWRLNRGHMELSTTAHIRGIHRRRVVQCGLNDGHQLYRLDVPKAYLGRISPGGTIGKHLWQIRPLNEWNEIARKLNKGRLTSSGFDSLGLGYGDPTYPVAVPNIYLRAALEQGKRLRLRYLIAAAAVASSALGDAA